MNTGKSLVRNFGAFSLSIALLGCASDADKAAGMNEEEGGVIYLASEQRVLEVDKDRIQEVRIANQPSSQLDITPVLLLDQNFTIQLGLFDRFQQASAFISTHKLPSEDAGIAEVVVDGALKFLLAYGVYADKSQAVQVSRQLNERLGAPMQVISLAEVEAMAAMANTPN